MQTCLPAITDEMLSWFEIIINERFGIQTKVELVDDYYKISNSKFSNSIFIGKIDLNFYKTGCQLNCYSWNPAVEGLLSVLGGSLFAPASQPLKENIINDFRIDYDILGLCYWMMNRMEEINSSDKDHYDRFAATSSHAFKNGYLDRPIVDEWLDIFKQVIVKSWIGVELKETQFKIALTHDIDIPSLYAFKSWRQIAYLMASHLKHKKVLEFFKAPFAKLFSKQKLSSMDPYNTFDWLMDQSEKAGLKSTFYFICGTTDPDKDGDYDIEHPIIQEIFKKIHRRGHEIALHPSFETYLSKDQINHELKTLQQGCAKAGVNQKYWAVRMHYLKWRHPVTLNLLNDAGFSNDSTLGYHDKSGFRCGTCIPYRGFDPLGNKILDIKVKPLILMESTLVGGVYTEMASSQDVLKTMNFYREICQKLNGEFVLLWHNSSFDKKEYFNIYSKFLE